MNYIVFDLEFNQPTCKSKVILDPFAFNAEIIQIGAVKLDEGFNVIGTLDILVKPKYYTKISAAVKRRICINHGAHDWVSFPEAYEAFSRFCGEECCLLSWSDSDVGILNANMRMHNILSDKSYKHFDVQRLFLEKIGNSKKQTSLHDAIEMIGTNRYVEHNAFNDAYSTAEIFASLKQDVQKCENSILLKSSATSHGKLFMDEILSSKDAARARLREIRLACSCGTENPISEDFALSKSKVLGQSCCLCGAEYLVTARLLKQSSGGINIKCYKQPMDAALKSFFLKQKKIDEAIKDYAAKHSHHRENRHLKKDI